jgi:DNA/RNA-binding domain of Phe-tRNA-synthetase-like protein
MPDSCYSIEKEIFDDFPGYCRGVVLGFGIKNSPSPLKLISMLRDAEEDLRIRVKEDEIASHPMLVSWREAYRSFGAKPTKYRSSIEAMVRRVVNKNEIPSINAIVDIGNIISLRHLTTVGGHAIDVVKQDIKLGKATGEEEFIPFGSDQVEHPLPGEIILLRGKQYLQEDGAGDRRITPLHLNPQPMLK